MSYHTMPLYTYSPLPPGNSTIRMFRLLPNKDTNARIECEIIVHSLEKRGEYIYEALSYVWGSTDNPSMIYINGCVLKVTSNLHAALSRLRLQRFERILWVDAICIDQENNTEKEQQIWLMSEIYGQAKNVIVWLGEEEDDSTDALESLRLIAEGDTPQADINDAALIALLGRPWFRRVWVLQEVGVARSVLVRCGPMEMTGYAFSSGLRKLESLNDRPQNLRSLVVSVRSVTYLLGRAIFRFSYGRRSKRRHPLGELLDMYHAHEATIRHDKVFALLGMCSDDLDAVGLLPHYDIPWDVLFRRVISHALSEDMSIETWSDKELALIKGKGHTLGRVSAAYGDKSRFDRQHVHFAFNSTAKSLGYVKVPTQGQDTGLGCRFVEWTLRVSAQSVKPGDIVCLLQGASKPSIARPFRDCFVIIMTGVTPLQSKVASSTSSRRSNIYEAFWKPAANCLREFLLVWNWESPSVQSNEQRIDALWPNINNLVPNSPETELDAINKLYDMAAILVDAGGYDEASKLLSDMIDVDGELLIRMSETMQLKYLDLLTVIYSNSNKCTRVVTLCKRATMMRKQLEGSEFPHVQHSVANLLSAYISICQYYAETCQVDDDCSFAMLRAKLENMLQKTRQVEQLSKRVMRMLIDIILQGQELLSDRLSCDCPNVRSTEVSLDIRSWVMRPIQLMTILMRACFGHTGSHTSISKDIIDEARQMGFDDETLQFLLKREEEYPKKEEIGCDVGMKPDAVRVPGDSTGTSC